MKNRICLAWFCDLDTPDRVRRKSRPGAAREAPPRESAETPRPPRVKEADELRRMFRPH
jgi:hypothetical protein